MARTEKACQASGAVSVQLGFPVDAALAEPARDGGAGRGAERLLRVGCSGANS